MAPLTLSHIFYKFILLFIFGFIGSSLLCVAFSSCGERGPLFVMVSGLLLLQWLLLLRSTGSRHAGSVVVAHGL